MYIAPIVEGFGEREAVPALLHRIAHGFAGNVRVNTPIRVKASSLFQDAEYLDRYVALAGAKAAQGGGMILILLDCEDRCPGVLGPELLRKAQRARADVPVFVALAYREYESWFLAAASSLRGLHGLPDDLVAPPKPESIRDAKGWLQERMQAPYDPVTHQLEFTRAFDLDQARTNKSFDRLMKCMETGLRACNGP